VLLAFIDNAGIPLPGGVDALLIAVAAVNPAQAYIAAALATVGAVAGCMALFYIARAGGQKYLERHTRSGKGLQFRNWYLRYGLITVFVPSISPIPLPTKMFVICAGALGVHPVALLLTVLGARAPRYAGLAWLGSQLGEHSAAWLRQHKWHLAGAALAFCLLIVLLIRMVDHFRASRA
jgi:membrane protein YqaA with SNARE-associated domain